MGGTLSDSLSRDGANAPLLEVQDLHVRFETSRGIVRAVDGISYNVNRGEVVAIVGKSGCGKSVSSLAIMRLLTKTSRIPAGPHPVRRAKPARSLRRRHALGARARHLHDLPGADDLAQSGPADRTADHGAAVHPSRDERGAGTRAGARAHAARRHHRRRTPARAISPSPLRRNAPARDDRHRARLQSQAHHRRRADDRARCHHPGADPGADEGSLAPARHRVDRHHP